MPSSSQRTYAANATDNDYVFSVRPGGLMLTRPAGQNFDSLRRVEVYISTTAGPNEQLLGALTTIPAGANSLRLLPTDAEVALPLQSTGYRLITKVELAQPQTTDATMQAQLSFAARAHVQ